MATTVQKALCLIAISSGCNAALGQSTASPDSSAQAPGLEEIVVTAQRREESLQHAAIAVTALSGSQLAEAGATKVEDLTQLVPALQVSPAAGPYPLFYLRGVGNFNGNALSDRRWPSISTECTWRVRHLLLAASMTLTDWRCSSYRRALYGRNATGRS